MPTRKPISPTEATILFYLRDEAADGCGWRRRGVRGWRLYSEVKAATREYVGERLPALAKHGLLERVDVREFGRLRATLLFRISEEGARRVAELEGRPREPLPAPGEDAGEGGDLFVPARSWSALETLRRHAADGVGPVRLGAHGWMTAFEVHEAHPRVRSGDVAWLVRRGLAEPRQAGAPGRARAPVTYYRVTEAGRRAVSVDAVPSPSGEVEHVEARVGEAGPGAVRKRASRRGSGSRPGAVPARGR